jgi:hypothetical protein
MSIDSIDVIGQKAVVEASGTATQKMEDHIITGRLDTCDETVKTDD